MPPRPPLPRLTLYTGGKECSLCEVAKLELAKVRQVRPFDLELFNIRSPPADVDAKEAKRWRRLYQYDIPVLHLEGARVQKHRINAPALIAALDQWQAQAQADSSLPPQANRADSPPTDRS
ncbi:uncharacterized protein MKK02DRAFT_40006 [Dioszegia hungarica]|uniref:Glutaredoxin-like protein n=1 Tax=Dioszegia hungarica TaxID=4972 RepID=A0AA38HFA7_9TREE|nr:uncharacterized protein MKK02DRAFT_40006 [Dioszegia hungarica]KAI9639685.1 hypothetical protein MKK02DRAFT_40006 [Dioszegia hungarica]